jgi:hypothetical protein
MQFTNKIGMLICGLTSLLIVANGNAGIISVTGDISFTSPPADVRPNKTENSNMVLFEEQQNVLLGQDLWVDIAAPGSYTGTSLAGGIAISSGTVVDSFYVHFDPILGTGEMTDPPIVGSITFDKDILGIIVTNLGTECGASPITDCHLSNSDFLGAIGTTYPGNIGNRVLEDNDMVTLSADRRTLNLSLSTYQTGIDQLRIIVDPTVPEPASFWLALVALFGIIHSRRRSPGFMM